MTHNPKRPLASDVNIRFREPDAAPRKGAGTTPEVTATFGEPRTLPKETAGPTPIMPAIPDKSNRPTKGPPEVQVEFHPGKRVPLRPRYWNGLRIPRSGMLRAVLMAFVTGIGLRLSFLAVRPDSFSEHAGIFIMNQVYPYLFGAIWSGIGIVNLIACAAAVAFMASILLKPFHSRRLARWTLGIVVVLSIFTLWVEPLILWDAAAFNALMKFAGLAVIDSLVTAFWVILWMIVLRHIDQELPGPTTLFVTSGSELRMSIGERVENIR